MNTESSVYSLERKTKGGMRRSPRAQSKLCLGIRLEYPLVTSQWGSLKDHVFSPDLMKNTKGSKKEERKKNCGVEVAVTCGATRVQKCDRGGEGV